jgi:hypothetical protein
LTLIVIAFHLVLVAFAYWIGRDRAGAGVAVFFAGVIGFQLFVNGSASFLDSGCSDYGVRAQSEDYC